MTSLILSTATRVLLPLVLLFSLLVMLRGHNEPGGGFVGGLIAAAAFALNAVAFDVRRTRRILRADPRMLIAVGLVAAAASGALALFVGKPFMTGIWMTLNIPRLQESHLSTPLLFDAGVYLVVLGVTLMIIFSLAEE
jgi:multicomponent Na+:H+ antiporter subunit B